ncbi:MAG: hypothetical protein M3Z64_02745 [Verrucomicrobiota bacterium]|nr:hypothetical protein [Verrucomicrobiota bacterium]
MLALFLGTLPNVLFAQGYTWERKAFGQENLGTCPGGTTFKYTYPNNSNWNQQQVIATAPCSSPSPSFEKEPSNWNRPDYPNGSGASVLLNGPDATNLNLPVVVDSLRIGSNGGLNLDDSGIISGKNFTFERDLTITHLVSQGGFDPAITATGTVAKTAGPGAVVIDPAIAFSLTGGTIDVQIGRIVLSGASNGLFSGGCNFKVAAGSVLDLTGGGIGAQFQDVFNGSGAGTVLFSSGQISAGNGGVECTFNLPGTLFQWTGGGFQQTVGGGAIVNTGVINLAGTGTKRIGGAFRNEGTFAFTGSGTLQLAGSFENKVTGIIDLRADANMPSVPSSFNPVINNAGVCEKTGGGETSVIDPIFKNAGAVDIQTGTIRFTQFSQTAGLLNLDGGNVIFTNEAAIDGGSIVGTGTITGNVRNTGGGVAPGHSPGKITISGNYVQGSGGTLTMEIGGTAAGTDYDQLVVSGQAALGGTLNVTLINGYRPAVGDVFQLILPGSFAGAFATVNTTGFTGQVNYSSAGTTITVLTVPDIPLNIATRIRVQPDPNELIGGFIITGTEAKKVIVRAIGPSLSSFFPDFLADPTLELFQGSTMLASNDNWKDTDRAAIEATGVAPKNDLESAIVRTLAPGAYTAIVRGKSGSNGIGSVEAYDLTPTSKSKFGNIASRGFVDTDNNVMIGGFRLGGGGGATSRVGVRASGASLQPFGVDNALADPTLELRDANGSLLQGNDNWKDTQQADIQATGLAPTNDLESAIVASLPDGAYTAIVRGKGNTTGVGVVEVYSVP